MAIVIVPLDSTNPILFETVQLDGVTYNVEVRFNERSGQWTLNLSDVDDVPIYSGVAIVVDFPLGLRCANDRRPKGALMAVDTSGAQLDPGADDLGTRVQLVYFEASELPTTPAPAGS